MMFNIELNKIEFATLCLAMYKFVAKKFIVQNIYSFYDPELISLASSGYGGIVLESNVTQLVKSDSYLTYINDDFKWNMIIDETDLLVLNLVQYIGVDSKTVVLGIMDGMKFFPKYPSLYKIMNESPGKKMVSEKTIAIAKSKAGL